MRRLFVVLALLLSPFGLAAQEQDALGDQLRVTAQLSLEPAIGVGVEMQFGHQWRLAPELFIQHGAATASASVLRAIQMGGAAGPTFYAGVGAGAFVTHEAGGFVQVRGGVEKTLGGDAGTRVRVEVRSAHADGYGGWGLVLGLQVR